MAREAHRQNFETFLALRLAQPTVLYNGQRYARTKEPTKTFFFRPLRVPHSKDVHKGIGELLAT